ncbi:MAG: hypothetical protein GY780_15340 [bacterium]|nr:hypothetical protein [bacterium]
MSSTSQSNNSDGFRGLSAEELKNHFRMMVRIRAAEEKIADLVRDEKIDENGDLVYDENGKVVRLQKEVICPAHLYSGEEAVAVGISASLTEKDYIFGAHRSHGHYLAKGGDLQGMMSEVFGRVTGCAHGRGGSMHLVAPEVGFPGATPIVASSIPHAVGAAMRSVIKGESRVAVSYFGDGATEEGRFHESLNLAATMKLPVIFVCENNLYSSHVRIDNRRPADSIYKHAEPFAMPGVRVDGNNFFEVYEAGRVAIERARSGAGPTLIEARTYRIHGHVGANLDLEKGLRNRMEFDMWMDRDPIPQMERLLISEGILNTESVQAIHEAEIAEVERCVNQARQDPWPKVEDMLAYTTSEINQPVPKADLLPRYDNDGHVVEHDIMNIGDSIREATEQLMDSDDSYVIIGQGVNSPWYVGNTAKGLFRKYGPKRVIDTPISEDAVSGATVGMSMVGMRPMVIHPRVDFALLGTEQFLGQAANWHYMTGGKVTVPLVARLIVNRGGEQAAQHSQSLQALFAHVPGLKVVMPSNAYDAKGLLAAALLSDDPVVYIDDRWAYGNTSEVPRELYTVELGKGVVRRWGTDLTIVASSYMNPMAIEAAEELAAEGIDVEIIDPRTLKPLDTEMILKSVAKTGKLLVADGGWDAYGFTAEVAAVVAASEVVTQLKAPVSRVGLPECPAPMSAPLEKNYFIDVTRLKEKIVELHRAGADSSPFEVGQESRKARSE